MKFAVVVQPPEGGSRNHEVSRPRASRASSSVCDGALAVGRMVTGVDTPLGLREVPARADLERQQLVVAAAHDGDGGAARTLALNDACAASRISRRYRVRSTRRVRAAISSERARQRSRAVCATPHSALRRRGGGSCASAIAQSCWSIRSTAISARRACCGQLTLARASCCRHVLRAWRSPRSLGIADPASRSVSPVQCLTRISRSATRSPSRVGLDADGALLVGKLTQSPIEQPSGGCGAVTVRRRTRNATSSRRHPRQASWSTASGTPRPSSLQHIDRVDLPLDAR